LIGYNTNTGGYSNSVLLGGSDSGTPISNTASNQFMLADTITGVRWRGVEYNLPSAQGGAATFLQNEGNGDLSWGAAPNTLWNAIADPSGNGAIAFGSTVQTMDWGTATTQNALSITGAALTTGKLLSLTSNSLTSGTLLDITSAGTAGLTNQKGLNIALSGTNGTSAQTTYGAYISNTHAGTTSTNVGLYATASGGTTANYAAIFDQGNVGIGTTTPEGALHINVASGNPLFRNLGVTQIQTSNASGAPGLILEASPNGNTSAITMSSSGLSFWTHSGSGNYVAGDVKMTINYTGLVGVGTTSPNANLEVAQTATATGALKGFIYTGAVNTNQTLSTEIPSFTITTAGRQWATGALTTQREVLITQPTYSFVGASTITNAATLAIAGAPIKSTNASITNTHALLIQAGAVSTATNSYGLTVNAQTGATNNYAAAFLGGNVGIGTTAPSTLLEIYNSSSSYSTLYLGGTTTNTVGIRFNPTVASSDTSNGHYGVDTRINFNPQGATTTNLYTNLVIANIASSTSNIGSLFGHYISNRTAATYSGALTNAYGLYVESTTSQYLGSKPTNNYGIFVHDQTGSTNDYAIYTNLGKVRFGDTVTIGSITSGLTNASNGLIAQGATTLGGTAGNYTYPAEVRFGSGNSSRLQFAGYRKITGADWTGTTARIQYAVDSSFTDGSKAYIDIGAGDPVTSGGGLISFGTAGSNRMSILNSGNVGIGIENPVVPFQVYSNSAAVRIGDGTNTAAYLQFSSDGTSNRATVGHDGAGFAVLQGGNTKGIHLNVNNNTFGSGTAMTVLSTGNVGIGTTSPTAKFHVLGTLTDTSGYIFATINSLNASPSGASTASYYANYTQAYTGNDNISANNQLYGVFNDISHLRTVTIGGTTGFYNRVTNNTTGTINSAIGTFSTIVNNSTGTIGTAYGEVIARPTNTAGGTITNTYGLYIYNQTAAAGTQTNVPYGIYQAGTGDRNYFGSKIGVGGNSTAPASILEIGSSDLGDGVAGPVLTLGRNTNATNTGAGSINFMKKDGTAGYVWQDAAGNMRINTAAPSNANDTAGTVIGAQTSTRDTKQDIADYMDYSNALSLVVNAPLHTFRYVNEVEGYGVDSPLAKIRIGYIADEVGPEFMVGNVIDQVSVNGLLMASIKELNLKITELETNQSSSFGEYALAFFSEVIEKVDNGVVYLKGVVVGTLKIGSPERRTGITLYDEITGEPYCLSVANGENKTTPGECLVITPAASIEAINPDTTTTTTTNTETNTDTVPPVIVLNGESNLSLSVGTTYSEEGATATDDKDGLVAVIISGSVDTTTVGTYTITYNASDAAGNAAISIERIINVTE